jgi:Mg2+/Co2+ transporter CorC
MDAVKKAIAEQVQTDAIKRLPVLELEQDEITGINVAASTDLVTFMQVCTKSGGTRLFQVVVSEKLS